MHETRTAPGGGGAVTLVIVADRDDVREEIASILNEDGIAITASVAFDSPRLESLEPDLAVFHPTDRDELDRCAAWRRTHPGVLTVVIFSEQTPDFLPANEEAAFDERASVHDVTEKLRSIIDRLSSFDERAASAVESKRLDELSEREIEVLKYTALGLSVTEIAAEMHRSENTVSSHRRSLHQKLGMANRVELARFAIRNGIIEA